MGRSKFLPVLAKVAGSLAARKVTSAIAKSSRRAPIRKRQTLAARMNRQMAKRASFKVGVPAARGPGPANPSFRGNLITVPFDVTSYTIRTDGNGIGIWSNGTTAGGYAFDLLPTKTYFGNYPFGPLINLQASAYQMYRILKLEFEYCPASQSGADGDILIAYTPDPWTGGSTSPIPYQTIGTLKDKMRSSLWGQNNDGKLVCRVKALNRSWLFINEDTPNPNPEAQRQAAAGSLIIGSQVPAAELNHNVGSLTLRGVIQFAGQGIVQASSVNGAGGPQSSLPLTAAAAAASYTQSLANTLTVATASQPLIGQSGLTSNGWVFSGPPFLFVASASVLTMPLSGVQPGSQFQITCSWTSATGIAAAATLSPNAVFGLAPPTVTNVVSLFDAGGASAQLTALITLPDSFSPSSSSISSTTANAGSYTFAIGGLTSMTAGKPNVVITQVA